MSTYNDDFWNDDYSEYELFINELKNTLKGQIKKEVTDEVSQLKKELTELKDYKDNLQKYNDEIEDLKNKLKIAEESVTKRAKELRLKDVLKLIEEPVYLIDSVHEYIIDKCDKCDEQRIIHFKSPSGKDYTEMCPYCNKYKTVYFPIKGKLLSIKDKQYESYENHEMQGIELKYTIPKYYLNECLSHEHDEFYYEVSKVYKTVDITKRNIYELQRMYYRNIEDCQKACDFMNNKGD